MLHFKKKKRIIIRVELANFYQFSSKSTINITLLLITTICHINKYEKFCQIFSIYKISRKRKFFTQFMLININFAFKTRQSIFALGLPNTSSHPCLQSPLWMMCSATICKWKILGKIVELVKLPSTIDFVNDFAMDNLKFPLPWLLAQMIPMKDNIV